jgi:hypothetical protein
MDMDMDMDTHHLPLLDITSMVALFRALVLPVVQFLMQGLMTGHELDLIKAGGETETRAPFILLMIHLVLTVIEDQGLQSLRERMPLNSFPPLVMAKAIQLALGFSLIYITS